jgi:hypothetical protein
MSRDDQTQGTTDHEQDQEQRGGQVSEGGSGGLNKETSQGGADGVPNTPDTSHDDDSFDGARPGQ